MKATVSVRERMEELATLTKSMDIPDFRRTSIPWLFRNMSARNSNHVNFPKAQEIVVELHRMGVR